MLRSHKKLLTWVFTRKNMGLKLLFNFSELKFTKEKIKLTYKNNAGEGAGKIDVQSEKHLPHKQENQNLDHQNNVKCLVCWHRNGISIIISWDSQTGGSLKLSGQLSYPM